MSEAQVSAQVSAHVPDWSREAKGLFQWAPSRALLAAIRSHQRHAGRRDPVSLARLLFAKWRHRFWSAVTGADIPLETQIGGGLLMPHPNGIVIHPRAVIGPNCLIMQQVTIGVNARGPEGKGLPLPVIGGHVDISVGAAILGSITVGDHAVIGAHALVVKDVPAGAVVLAPLGEIRTMSQAGETA